MPVLDLPAYAGARAEKMDFYGDYHTHTLYSHGKGTVEDNAFSAKGKGLREIAITDHGLRHVFFGLRDGKVKSMRSDIGNLACKDISVLSGVEANIISLDGTIDVDAEHLPCFDVIVCGFHKSVYPKELRSAIDFFAGNILFNFARVKSSAARKVRNTDAFIKAIEKNRIDVISHIKFGIDVDCAAIAEAAREKGTFIELSGRKITYSDAEFESMAKTGVRFVMDSDAHTPERIGDFAIALNLLKRTGYPLDELENYKKRPNFRSFREKSEKKS